LKDFAEDTRKQGKVALYDRLTAVQDILEVDVSQSNIALPLGVNHLDFKFDGGQDKTHSQNKSRFLPRRNNTLKLLSRK
jgi:hypothetical protein